MCKHESIPEGQTGRVFYSVLTFGISQKGIFGTGVCMDQISLYANALEVDTRWIYVAGIYAVEEGNCVYSNVTGKCKTTLQTLNRRLKIEH